MNLLKFAFAAYCCVEKVAKRCRCNRKAYWRESLVTGAFISFCNLDHTKRMAQESMSEDVFRYDFVIFGATGFTGQFCVEEMIRTAEKSSVSWAVAGRSYDKLKVVVNNAYTVLGKKPEEIPIIVADVSDLNSLGKMCSRAKIILNTVGPYRFYGEPVIKACIESKTHHIDISGEPQFLERMQLDYHQLAKDAGVYIIGSCGFDSIPCEMGLQYLRQQFPGDVAYVDVYASFIHGPSGVCVNFGTWQSAIHGFAHWSELKPLRKKLFPERLPKSKYAPPTKKTIFYSNEVDGWCLPFPAADKPVVIRSQYQLYAEEKIRPFYMSAYVRVPSLFAGIMTIFAAVVFALLASFGFGRALLEKYPGFFSLGLFSRTGPTRQQIKESSFVTTIIGTGHEGKVPNPTDEHPNHPDTKLVVKVKGPEPGYVTTPICMIQAGMILLEEIDKLPGRGGVYTPGGAFVNTRIIDRLTANGLDFVSGNPLKLTSS